MVDDQSFIKRMHIYQLLGLPQMVLFIFLFFCEMDGKWNLFIPCLFSICAFMSQVSIYLFAHKNAQWQKLPYNVC